MVQILKLFDGDVASITLETPDGSIVKVSLEMVGSGMIDISADGGFINPRQPLAQAPRIYTNACLQKMLDDISDATRILSFISDE